MDFVNFLIQLLNSVQYGLLLFMLAAGLTLIFGIMGVVNLAHGSFYMLGAYLAWSLAALTNSFTLAIIVGTVLSVLFGLLLEWLLFRHFYKRDHLDQVLLTFGLIYVFEETRSILWGDDVHGVTIPDALSASIPLTETLSYPVYRLFMSGVCLLLALGLVFAHLQNALGHENSRWRFQSRNDGSVGRQHQTDSCLGFCHGRGLGHHCGHGGGTRLQRLSQHGLASAHHVFCGGGYWRHWLGQRCSHCSHAGGLGRYLWQSLVAASRRHAGLCVDGHCFTLQA
jgi:branched-chain amino acid transport system permease protein